MTLTFTESMCSTCNMKIDEHLRFRSTLERLGELKGSSSRVWVGPTPTEGSVIPYIASNVGLDAQNRESDFHPLCKEDAAIWLTLFASQSLLHFGSQIPIGAHEEISTIFGSLGTEAQFFSKGVWQQTRRLRHYELVGFGSAWNPSRHRLLFQGSSEPLAPIDVLEDGGIIGFDSTTAFIFWVEEDD